MSQLYFHDISPNAGSSRIDNASGLFADRTQAAPDRETVERFREAIGDADEERGGSRVEEPSSSQRGDLPAPMQDTSSLFSMHASFESLFADSVEQTAIASALNGADLDMLVERILVSSPERGGHEVRLILGGDILCGTEIIIQRDTLGLLSVQLHANDTAAFQTLVASQNELRHLLEVRETSPVRVLVDNGGDSANDANRRSKGLFQQNEAEA